jgi:hypothetical protein
MWPRNYRIPAPGLRPGGESCSPTGLSQPSPACACVCFSLPRQVLYNTVARVVPQWDAAAAAFVLAEAELPFFVDSEWALDSPTTPHTMHLLHLVVYVPPRAHCPLLVRRRPSGGSATHRCESVESGGFGGGDRNAPIDQTWRLRSRPSPTDSGLTPLPLSTVLPPPAKSPRLVLMRVRTRHAGVGAHHHQQHAEHHRLVRGARLGRRGGVEPSLVRRRRHLRGRRAAEHDGAQAAAGRDGGAGAYPANPAKHCRSGGTKVTRLVTSLDPGGGGSVG